MKQATEHWDESATVDAEVERLLQQFSLDDKINLVSGRLAIADDGSVPPLPQGLPLLALADGPGGLHLANPRLPDHRATALPVPIALAATWDPDLAARYGHVLGTEAAATGHNIFLGPAVDIARAPRGGRTFESFGEDPLLQSRLVAPEIAAIQSHHVIACLKHYVANNQEHRRSTVDVQVDERTLHELYLPPFAAAVQGGHAAALMGSYNRLNGTYVCEHPEVLTSVLRGQWGFRGFVMSDFLANPSTVASAEAGLDWELGPKLWGAKLRDAFTNGELAAATLDEMVKRILRPVVGLGLQDVRSSVEPLPVEEHSAEALAIAERAIVLLKNQDDLLPLDANAMRSIAVIGADADSVSAAGGGSGYVQPLHSVSVLDGIRRRVGASVRVEYADGTDPVGAGALLPGPSAIPSSCFAARQGERKSSGLLVEYWDNPNFAGDPLVSRVEPRAELNFGFFDLHKGMNAASAKLPSKPQGLPNRFSARWSGALSVPSSGIYELALTCLGTARVTLDGKVLDSTVSPAAEYSLARLSAGLPPGAPEPAIKVVTTSVTLEAGTSYPINVDYTNDVPGYLIFGEAMLRLGWSMPQGAVDPKIAAAAEMARKADAAVVVVRTYETEEMDRPDLRLPNEQDLLIRAVAAANPRTVVVLMNAGPIEVASWEEGVPSILEGWYGGQEQGAAIARVLFGDVNPSGKLPITFPRDESQTPIATPEQYPGIGGAVHYSEGVYVGYRGYEKQGIEPQYPFGHGLSYTTFAYENLQITPAAAAGGETVTIRFDIQNTGSWAGAEVTQVYLLPPGAEAKRLAGWARVYLEPGQRREVSVVLEENQGEHPFSTWDSVTHDWRLVEGEYGVIVGGSVQDVRLVGKTVVGA